MGCGGGSSFSTDPAVCTLSALHRYYRPISKIFETRNKHLSRLLVTMRVLKLRRKMTNEEKARGVGCSTVERQTKRERAISREQSLLVYTTAIRSRHTHRPITRQQKKRKEEEKETRGTEGREVRQQLRREEKVGAVSRTSASRTCTPNDAGRVFSLETGQGVHLRVLTRRKKRIFPSTYVRTCTRSQVIENIWCREREEFEEGKGGEDKFRYQTDLNVFTPISAR